MVFHEKPVVSLLLVEKSLPPYYVAPKVQYHIHKIPSICPLLGQINLFHARHPTYCTDPFWIVSSDLHFSTQFFQVVSTGGPSCSCKHRILWISPIFEYLFCLNYVGTVHHWQPFWSTKSVRFIGQCWYFNPQWTSVQAVNKASSVWNLLVSWDKMRSYYVSAFKSGFVEGFRRWKGYILALQRNPGLQGSCSLRSSHTERGLPQRTAVSVRCGMLHSKQTLLTIIFWKHSS